MGRLIGYARVSTANHDLQLQLEVLQRAGCHDAWISRDIASGARTIRPGPRGPCASRSFWGHTGGLAHRSPEAIDVHLVTVIEELLRRQVGFRSRCDGAIDTTTASGELIFHIFSALVQFERWLIQERTRAGLTAARARGKHGGRRPLRPEDPRIRMASMMYGDQRLTVAEICRTLCISPATFYRYVALGRRAADHTSGTGGPLRGRTSFET
jgi:DNA invertase Pin-like site-specific DNA recombinase